ncbi:MAG: OsmC family protein [Chloroflexota bacterium]|nr:OsmC family protein [Chloroflexota bacterium]
MRTVSVAWDGQAERFTASGTHPGQTIDINAPHEPDSDHPPTGFSASELILAGVGSCAAWDIVEILRKGRQDVTAIDVRVEGTQDAEQPWPYRSIVLHFTIRGRAVSETAVERAIALSTDRYCSAIATVRGVAEIGTSFEVVAVDDDAA